MRHIVGPLTAVLSLSLVTAAPLSGQEPGVRQQLLERGAPTEFADQVAAIVAAADEASLPTEPIVSKALEGWAKRGRVPPDRVITVLTQLTSRLAQGRDLTRGAGLDPPPGMVVAAAAEALGRGMGPDDVRDVLAASPTPEAASTGLTVASSLAAQGLGNAAAVRAIRDAYRSGRPPEEVLEYPSAVTDLLGRGERMADVARRILQGGGLPLPSGPGVGNQSGRPQSVPGARGSPPGAKGKKVKSGQP